MLWLDPLQGMEKCCTCNATKRRSRFNPCPHETGKEAGGASLVPRDRTAPQGCSFIFTSQLAQFKGEPRRLGWWGHLEWFFLFFSSLQELFRRQQRGGANGRARWKSHAVQTSVGGRLWINKTVSEKDAGTVASQWVWIVLEKEKKVGGARMQKQKKKPWKKKPTDKHLVLHHFSFALNAALIDSETAEDSHLARVQICVWMTLMMCVDGRQEPGYLFGLGLKYWLDLWCQSVMLFTTCVIERLLRSRCKRSTEVWKCCGEAAFPHLISGNDEWMTLR